MLSGGRGALRLTERGNSEGFWPQIWLESPAMKLVAQKKQPIAVPEGIELKFSASSVVLAAECQYSLPDQMIFGSFHFQYPANLLSWLGGVIGT